MAAQISQALIHRSVQPPALLLTSHSPTEGQGTAVTAQMLEGPDGPHSLVQRCPESITWKIPRHRERLCPQAPRGCGTGWDVTRRGQEWLGPRCVCRVGLTERAAFPGRGWFCTLWPAGCCGRSRIPEQRPGQGRAGGAGDGSGNQGEGAGRSHTHLADVAEVLDVHALGLHDLLDDVGAHLLRALGVLVAAPARAFLRLLARGAAGGLRQLLLIDAQLRDTGGTGRGRARPGRSPRFPLPAPLGTGGGRRGPQARALRSAPAARPPRGLRTRVTCLSVPAPSRGLTLTKLAGNQASFSALRPHHQSLCEASRTWMTSPALKPSSCSSMVTWSQSASAQTTLPSLISWKGGGGRPSALGPHPTRMGPGRREPGARPSRARQRTPVHSSAHPLSNIQASPPETASEQPHYGSQSQATKGQHTLCCKTFTASPRTCSSYLPHHGNRPCV